jgi:two-component system response regulator NreC
VFLVDSRTVVREGLCALIDRQPELMIVGHAGGVGSVEQVAPTPDVVVTEIELADANGPDVIRRLRAAFPSSSILVLTLVDNPARIQAVLAAGADGYMLKTSCSAELTTAIRTLAHGETYLQPSLGVALSRWHSPHDSTVRLTPAEERILGLVALGHTNAEMAERTGVSVRTVETHRAGILQKLGRRTRAELVQYAWSAGLIDANSR